LRARGGAYISSGSTWSARRIGELILDSRTSRCRSDKPTP
jgi:hypothetical protein